MGFNSVTIPSPGNNVAAGMMSKPLVFDQNALFGAPYDPGLNVVAGGGIQGAPALVDPNMGRPSRVVQWNVSLQREILRDLVVEAAFVGNHGVWLDNGSSQGFSNASVGNLINYNAVSPATLAAYGLGDLTNANTRSLLNSTITSAAAVAAGFKKPYANFPDSGSVLQSLRPFPQYSGIGQFQAPLGNSWYDSLQVKVIKRISHGLTATMAYTFGKALDSTTNAGSIYDRDSFKGLSPSYYPAHLQPQRGLHRAGHRPGQAQPHCQGDAGRLENHQPEHESERRSAWRRRARATRSAVICPRATREWPGFRACRCT